MGNNSYCLKLPDQVQTGKEGNTDGLKSAEMPNYAPVPGGLILMMGALSYKESPETFKDPLLSQVRHMILHKDELSIQGDCIFRGGFRRGGGG